FFFIFWGLYLMIPTIVKAERVRYVVDGDTFVLEDGRKVRMLGIDTPELYHADYFAVEAKDRLRDLIAGKQIELQLDRFSADTDRYGRNLRYVHFMERDVNLQMIEEGYARAYPNYKIERLRQYQKAEEQASAAGIGLWQKTTALTNRQELLLYGLGLTFILLFAAWKAMRRIRRR
ncbi:MAG: thermonuclease family protein, partial [Bacteroidota bacterium]